MVKVSVIVPVYNAEKYLHKCLDSLVNQTLEDIEIVLVNDGSTDNSGSILKEYQDRFPNKVKVFNKENGGQATARNLAIEKANGEYLAFVDSDDYADTSLCEKMVKKAEEMGVDMVVCDHYEVRGDKLEYKRFKDYLNYRDMFVDALVSPWNKLIRKSTYVNSGVIFPEGYIYEDTAWFANLIPHLKNFAVIHEALLFHAINENSTMTKKQEERTANIFPVMEYVWQYFHDSGLYEEYKTEVEYFFTRIMFMSSLQRISKVKNRKLKKSLFNKTYSLMKERFPNYKKNKYLKGARKIYIKLINSVTAPILMFFISLKG